MNYKLSNHKTGETIEETTTENPMVFLFGVGGIIPEFEENISGLSVGDAFEFSIQAENAYGLPDENQVAMIPMSDSEGNHLRGIIRDVTAEAVQMDFNHPLAGTDLHFSGSIAAIRPATDDELAHGHVHGPGGHQH